MLSRESNLSGWITDYKPEPLPFTFNRKFSPLARLEPTAGTRRLIFGQRPRPLDHGGSTCKKITLQLYTHTNLLKVDCERRAEANNEKNSQTA